MPELAPNSTVETDVTAELISRFHDLILEGVLFPGCRLPPERELASRFGVSRAALRQALKVLAIMGVLSQRVGDGTYLGKSAATILDVPMDFLMALEGLSIYELWETRVIVEPELAARAAQRATTDDLEAMRQSLKPIRPFSVEKMFEQDLAFDRAIFRAAGNRVCERIFSLLHRPMLQSIHQTYQMVDWEHTVAFHKPIYQAIQKRDAEEARGRMLAHLENVRELLNRANAKPKTAALPHDLRSLVVRRPGRRTP